MLKCQASSEFVPAYSMEAAPPARIVGSCRKNLLSQTSGRENVILTKEKYMAKCTAPINGHRTESGRLNCPVCGKYGGRRSYYSTYGYTSYSSYSSTPSSKTSYSSSSFGGKKKAKWSPAGSTVLYTPAEIRTLTPIRENVVKQPKFPEKYDLFLCHAWDDRKGVAKELCDKLSEKGIAVWFSEKDLPLGSTMLREIDKGLAKSRAGIVLVTPSFLKRVEGEGVAEKELSALLAKDRLIPILHNTTYEALRNVSPLLGSRSGLDTSEDSMDDVVSKLAELFSEDV